MKSLRKFKNNLDHYKFENIDYEFLSEYERFMREGGENDGGIYSYMRNIRTIFNGAIKYKIVQQQYYPFRDYKLSKFKKRKIRKALTEAEFQALLNFDFEKAIPANSFKAHQFAHFAKANGKQNEAEEKLFQVYFIDGKNVDDAATLLDLANELGLSSDELKTDLESEKYADAVRFDMYEAQQIGVRGVPFFVLDRKYAVSGAQESSSFLEILQKSFNEWQRENSEQALDITNGDSCSVDGECD